MQALDYEQAETSGQGERKRRTQRERREGTRERLIEATIALLAERGFGNVTVQDIVRAAGVTSGALQHHFKSKDELVQAAADRIFFRINAPMNITGELKTLEERCRFAVESSWSVFGQPNYFVAWEIILGGRTNPAFWARYKHYRNLSFENGLSVFRSLFEGYVDDEEKLSALLHFCWDSLRGVALLRVFDEPEATMMRHRDLLVHALHDAVLREASSPSPSAGDAARSRPPKKQGRDR